MTTGRIPEEGASGMGGWGPRPTIKKFGVVNRYDLSKVPGPDLRQPDCYQSCTDELLWIWRKVQIILRSAQPHCGQADEDGSIGKAYGYQMGSKAQV